MNWKRTSPCPKAVDAWCENMRGKPTKYIRLKNRRVIAYRANANSLSVIFRCLHKDERKIADTAIRLSNEAIDALHVLKNIL